MQNDLISLLITHNTSKIKNVQQTLFNTNIETNTNQNTSNNINTVS